MSITVPEVYFNDRSDRGRLVLTGRDRQSFLQGMVTNDILALAPGDGCYAFLLDPTGHVLADMRVLATDNYLLLDTEPGMASFLAATLDRYLIMEKCRIADNSQEFAQIFVGGRRAASLVQQLFGVPDTLIERGEGANYVVALGATPNVGLLALTHWTADSGFDIYAPVAHKLALIDALESAGAHTLEDDLLESLRIEAGVPRFGVDIDAKVLAPETGQQSRAISYRKGCYIGQEIVARIDARGHANRTLAGFLLTKETLPATNDLVEVEGRDVGRITSAVISPTWGRPIALGYIRNEFTAPGTPVNVAGSAARVSPLPFVPGRDNIA